MGARTRKLALTLHVVASVGWIGAVAAFLALAITGLTSRQGETVRGAYIAMETTGWFVIVPFSLASLVTGIAESLVTSWGLLRHYWVVFKLLMTVLATAILLIHMQPTSRLADVAASGALSAGGHDSLRVQLAADAAAAVVVLLLATALSIYKPRGTTPYGARKAHAS